ncbi:hypothetical protein CLF_111185 [Clonorchis sinensis]|uniref:BTB domain-containing protein n=1 Tax=Clonorchis sinensis TaxID=79923 RepID=G7YLH5_CLOSI|nr:hypothetical protein CLF_111185 [Clonorchis sinensis]
MAFAVKTAINAERTSAKFHKTKTFDYDGTADVTTPDVNCGEPDVTFLVERDVFHGHQHLFSKFSKVLGECFGASQNGSHQIAANMDTSPGVSNSATMKKITIDAPVPVFEAVFNFCYTRKLSVPVNMLPSVYLLAKRLRIEEMQRPCAEYLADHITIGNVGQLCQLIQFGLLKGSFEPGASEGETLSPYELRLTSSLYTYVQENADALACSLSGQLSARLIVNLTCESLPDSERNGTEQLLSEDLVFGVLMWARQRIVSGQRLARSGSEENVQSDDEESDGGTSSSGSATLERKTKQTRVPNLSLDRLDWLSTSASCISALEIGTTSERYRPGKYEPKDANCKKVTNETLQCKHAATQDIRITLDVEELPTTSPTTFSCFYADDQNGTVDSEPRSRHPSQLLTFCPSDGSETCVLAPTSLGGE